MVAIMVCKTKVGNTGVKTQNSVGTVSPWIVKTQCAFCRETSVFDHFLWSSRCQGFSSVKILPLTIESLQDAMEIIVTTYNHYYSIFAILKII